MTISIGQPRYLPNLPYLHRMASVDLFVILDDVPFTRHDESRGRLPVHGRSDEDQFLTIPVHRDHLQQPFQSVRALYRPDWPHKHLATLRQAYGKSPFWQHRYGATIEALYSQWRQNQPSYLAICLALLRNLWLPAYRITTKVVLASSLGVPYQAGPERLVELARVLQATHYLSGQSGQQYGASEAFSKSTSDTFNCTVSYHTFASEHQNRSIYAAIHYLLTSGPTFF